MDIYTQNNKEELIDEINLPQGYIKLDLTRNKTMQNIISSIKSFFPSSPKYHYPKVIPDIDGYNTFQPLIRLEESINFDNIYYLDDIINKVPDLYKVFEIPEIHNVISKYYSTQYDSGYMVYHVSSYRSFSDSNDCSGYQKWHSDNFPKYCKKLLIYLDDIENENDGPSQIKKDNNVYSILGKKGTSFFFDMNTLHRGKKLHKDSKNKYRDIIYFSICPYKDKEIVPIQSLGTDVLYPNDLQKTLVNGIKKQYANLEKSYLNIPNNIKCVNIGGGTFSHKDWINLDFRDSTGNSLNQFKFDLSLQKNLPLKDASINYIYSSHCFEHLDEETNIFTFNEISRIIHDRGKFLLKLPNFELTVEKYLQKDYSFFKDNWGITKLEKTWLNNNINPTIDNYFIMIFASYSNFGSQSLYERTHSSVYYGPPKVSREELAIATKTMSIKELSNFLVNKIPKDAHQYGHINAFSESDICSICDESNLKVTHISTEPNSKEFDEFKKHLGTEELEFMKKISKYYIIEKK